MGFERDGSSEHAAVALDGLPQPGFEFPGVEILNGKLFRKFPRDRTGLIEQAHKGTLNLAVDGHKRLPLFQQVRLPEPAMFRCARPIHE